MGKERKRYSVEFKFRVALEAYKGERTLAELSSQYGVHSSQILKWKKQLLETGARQVYGGQKESATRGRDEYEDGLLRTIGRLQVEVEFLKKKSVALGLV